MVMRGFIARFAYEIALGSGTFNGATVQRERAHVLEVRHAVAAFFQHDGSPLSGADFFFSPLL
jgi:hypothetical protein